ncbi:MULTISPECIES: hypothetical protein [Rhodomicrobium]|uniref:hypothetical protein n=1 Tax=Rhodomicrobium TaxID=1068 RepID=UPI000F740944|nr:MULTISPECIES: hypothetical protein [Rhodomicrobium]
MARRPLKILAASCALTLAIVLGQASGAHAFTETKVPPPPGQGVAPEGAPAQLQIGKPEDGNGMALSSPATSQAGGTELTIPGVGSVGTLPKLDFGLELLYGAGNSPAAEKPEDEKNDDVLIKGTIKHRF